MGTMLIPFFIMHESAAHNYPKEFLGRVLQGRALWRKGLFSFYLLIFFLCGMQRGNSLPRRLFLGNAVPDAPQKTYIRNFTENTENIVMPRICTSFQRPILARIAEKPHLDVTKYSAISRFFLQCVEKRRPRKMANFSKPSSLGWFENGSAAKSTKLAKTR